VAALDVVVSGDMQDAQLHGIQQAVASCRMDVKKCSNFVDGLIPAAISQVPHTPASRKPPIESDPEPLVVSGLTQAAGLCVTARMNVLKHPQALKAVAGS